MNAKIKELLGKYDALTQREKIIVAAAVVFGILLLGHSLWVEPGQLRARTLTKQIAQQRSDLQALQVQLTVAGAKFKDPDAANKAELAEVKAKLAETDRNLHAYDNALVQPDKVPQLLQSLLAKHRGLELVSLQNLPPTPLLARKPEPKEEAKPTEAKPGAAEPLPPGSNIHKHGIEIRLLGNYLDLLAYVSEVEQMPQKLLWGRASLRVSGYPKSELTLTVYTLSLDSRWLVV